MFEMWARIWRQMAFYANVSTLWNYDIGNTRGEVEVEEQG